MDTKYRNAVYDLVAAKLDLQKSPVDKKYEYLVPMRAMGLVRFKAERYTSRQLESITFLRSRIAGFIRMFSLVIRPSFSYRLPLLSTEAIFIGSKRIIIFEVIDTTSVADTNLTLNYGRISTLSHNFEGVGSIETAEWYKKTLADCSFKLTAQKQDDKPLFSFYIECINTFMEMAKNATQVDDKEAKTLELTVNEFLDTLLLEGGPAVNVFRRLLGAKGQREYVRNVMFGMD